MYEQIITLVFFLLCSYFDIFKKQNIPYDILFAWMLFAIMFYGSVSVIPFIIASFVVIVGLSIITKEEFIGCADLLVFLFMYLTFNSWGIFFVWIALSYTIATVYVIYKYVFLKGLVKTFPMFPFFALAFALMMVW